MGVKQVIKNLDAFPRAEEHLLQKTQSGAVGKFFQHWLKFTWFLHEHVWVWFHLDRFY